MASLTVLNASGDTRVTWSKEAYVDGDPEAIAAVAEAERLFAQARATGGEAFRIRKGELARRVSVLSIDEDVLVIPRMVGG